MNTEKLTPQEAPYFDKNGTEIKPFAVLKMFHFTGRNEQGRGRKHYYMYKWVKLKEFSGKLYWIACHLTNDREGSHFNLKAVANKDRQIPDAEVVQQYDVQGKALDKTKEVRNG